MRLELCGVAYKYVYKTLFNAHCGVGVQIGIGCVAAQILIVALRADHGCVVSAERLIGHLKFVAALVGLGFKS